MKNLLIKWLIDLVKCWRTPCEEPNFLIVSTTGLGDSIWGTPALRALREAYPESYIGLLTSRIGAEVFHNNPHSNKIFTLKSSSFFSYFRLYFSMKKKKFGTIFIFHTSQRAVLPFCFLLGAKTIIGTEGINKGLDFILTKTLPQKPIHEIARRIEIVNVIADKPFLELFLNIEDKEKAQEFLKCCAIPSYLPMIGLHPGAKDKFKQWPPEHFVTLGKRLVDTLGCQIFITGDKSEKELVHKIASQIPNAIAIAGDLPVRAFAAFLHQLHLFITNDTGPMHIAYAMNTPTVALFSPTAPKICGPYLAPRVSILARPPSCSPCLRKRCREPFCMMQIGPEDVYNSAIHKLGNLKN